MYIINIKRRGLKLTAEESSALFVNALHYGLPGIDLGLRVDAWGVERPV